MVKQNIKPHTNCGSIMDSGNAMEAGNKKLGIVLGSGGSRAFVHLGILKALAEENIPVCAITGSSMGAILGGMYAFNPDADMVCKQAMDYFGGSKLFGMNPKPAKNDGLYKRKGVFGKIAKFMVTMGIASVIGARQGLKRKNIVHISIDNLLPDRNIAETQIPFACVAINLTDGCLEVFKDTSIRQATKAGTSVGVVYSPFWWDEKQYAD
ncbi:MAG: patatin-like phospholipase family protein, partial [Planctomycetes bacterium]|nr:patatin-like phospholipase family protein [Planctomycetota bacterium]